MWCDHRFSQRNKTTKRALVVGVGSDRKGRVGQIWKGGYLHKIARLGTLCQLCLACCKKYKYDIWLILHTFVHADAEAPGVVSKMGGLRTE